MQPGKRRLGNQAALFFCRQRRRALPPGLRPRPHTGALYRGLLLLFAGCLQPQSTSLKAAAWLPDKEAAISSEPPQGAAAQPRGHRYGRGVGFDEQPKAQQFKAKKTPSTLTGEGAVFGSEPPPGGAATGGRGAKAFTKIHGPGRRQNVT